MTETKTATYSRNEPCPCGSGKKYKRCCGINAAPQLFQANEALHEEGGQENPLLNAQALDQMDDQKMAQFSNALKRLPKGKLQRLQAIMQKAMGGRDVSQEASEFEKSLPVELQTLMQALSQQSDAQAAKDMSSTQTQDENKKDKKLQMSHLWKFWARKKK